MLWIIQEKFPLKRDWISGGAKISKRGHKITGWVCRLAVQKLNY